MKLGNYGYCWQKVIYESNVEFCTALFKGILHLCVERAVSSKLSSLLLPLPLVMRSGDGYGDNGKSRAKKATAESNAVDTAKEQAANQIPARQKKVWVGKRQSNKNKEMSSAEFEQSLPAIVPNGHQEASQDDQSKGLSERADVGPSGAKDQTEASPGVVVGKEARTTSTFLYTAESAESTRELAESMAVGSVEVGNSGG